ncbi:MULTISPECIES: sugar kinase [unclassified Mesorhizobium]|uniref:sugar kinase n=1 Tax=unclassified Mesorhizobium TaxID=325217 RepID=UPI000F763326|nr:MULTISPECIES: sugar kinase [unclassified Mesorhizobium]AZO03116.1 sugar kinase [Mesorhizobium sp. M2A.F.Ca.ET.043.02.1.1]RUW43369.1 sugar kinase [Mesorhizobium sp. M2A.F.Ca.ET.015.02.1.1]RUW76937.1 sugar kinase [Mesorhizobium sp. M2A.F.Ca.ET.067.02.1.1]RVC98226.1 sugar kinase [Mesorhizobium sp. M2A.F.Ca.ET.017.03.2.1]RVD11873.1 sugar kinase [Mesorhizobium sp. M2A.F.Ca.ET.029.05.1.1]
MKKLVSAGEILVEIMADRIGQSFLEPGPLVGPFPSGAPAIFIGQAAALGQPAGLIGAVGEDDFGQLNIDRLRALGADVSAITSHKGYATGTAFVTYRADASRHFVFNIRNSAAGLLDIDDAARHLLADTDHFHVMGSSLFSDKATDVVLAATAAVKARGGTVSFDPNVRREIMQDSGMREALDSVLAQTDVFLPSGNELLLFSSAGDEQGAIAELLGRGIACIVLKRGADGAVYHDRQRSVAMPGFAVEEVDPTGAGDCFGAAFVSFWLRGAAPAEALRIANACGALAVTRKGPMEGIHRLADVEAFIVGAGTRA